MDKAVDSSEILECDNYDPLCGLSREQFLKILTEKLSGRVEEAYIFGSFAQNQLHPESDVDLILVKETNVSFVERGKEFLDLLKIGPTLDILVYTKDEFERLTTKPTIGFWEEVVSSLLRIL